MSLMRGARCHRQVYKFNSLVEVEEFVLEGWCAWKYAFVHGISPFDLHSHPAADIRRAVEAQAATDQMLHNKTMANNLINESAVVSKSLYDARADACTLKH